MDILQGFKNSKDRFPLLLRGARQVGKTWAIREHAKQYESFIEINLESNNEYILLFKEFYGKPQDLLRGIELLSKKKLGLNGLLFIDEIQISKEAILALRYFKEQIPQLAVIGAGSLIEFTLSECSFPVGRIQFIYLFPMNFFEFLYATDNEHLVAEIKNSSAKKSLPQTVHERLMSLVGLYCLIGGMPKVVQTYVETKDLQACQEHQQILVSSLREDFYKYSKKADVENVRMLFNAVPALLGNKFVYSRIDAGIKSNVLSKSLILLEQAGLVYKAFHTSASGLPLGAQINLKKFKAFFLDIGLCQRLLGLELSQLYLEHKTYLINRGALAEQFVAQEIISYTPKNKSPELFYWHREEKSSMAEVDFLIEKNGRITPLEVKSGVRGHAKSMQQFLSTRQELADTGVVISAANFTDEEKQTKIPFYALYNIFHSTPEFI